MFGSQVINKQKQIHSVVMNKGYFSSSCPKGLGYKTTNLWVCAVMLQVNMWSKQIALQVFDIFLQNKDNF